jgi:radical SAM superfamily enzyme YgiQ (UPF0313 family)
MKIKLYTCSLVKRYADQAEHSLGVGYLKTNCTNADIEIVKNKEDLKDCDMIGLSCFIDGGKQAIDILNNTNIPVIIGGPISKWDGLAEYDFKHIVVGEGELALQSIIDGNETEKIVSKPPIENLDTLNYPERGRCSTRVPITSSRGCVYECGFCLAPHFWKTYRYNSPEYFIGEVEYILDRYPHAEVLMIQDNLFAGNRETFYRIYDLWMKKGLNKKIKLEGSTRTSHFDYEFGCKLKEMGFQLLAFGFESASDRVLKIINKKTTVKNHQKVIDICTSLEIPIHGCFMHGIPGETIHDAALTTKFMWDNKTKFRSFNYHKFRPYPGCNMQNDKYGAKWKI